jgi:hypothetical protein
LFNNALLAIHRNNFLIDDLDFQTLDIKPTKSVQIYGRLLLLTSLSEAKKSRCRAALARLSLKGGNRFIPTQVAKQQQNERSISNLYHEDVLICFHL